MSGTSTGGSNRSTRHGPPSAPASFGCSTPSPRGDIDAVGDLTPLDWAPALTIKAVSIYFPDAVLPIQSHAHLEHFWALLGGEGDIEWNIPGARQLRKLVREQPEFAGWSTREIMWFLYDWAHPAERRPDRQDRARP